MTSRTFEDYTNIYNVKDYGAVGDGTTDDTVAIQAAIDSADEGAMIFLPSGHTFIVSSDVVVAENNVSFILDGILKASDSFSGVAVLKIMDGDTGATSVKNLVIGGNGIIDGNHTADKGIDVVYAVRSIAKDLKIIRCVERAVHIGSHVDRVSYGFDVSNLEIWFHEEYSGSPPTNTETSIGLHYEKGTDGIINTVKVMGYRTGFRSDGGSNFFSNCHTWNRIVHGPLEYAFYVNASGNKFINCYADTATPAGDVTITDVYGFYLNGWGTELVNIALYLNSTYGEDNVFTGVYCNKTNSQTAISNIRITSNSDSHRYKDYFAGNLEGVTRTGVVDDGRVANQTESNLTQTIGGRDLHIHSDTMITGDSGELRILSLGTNDIPRFQFRLDSNAESGSDVGSNFELIGRTDDGSYKHTPMKVDRATGKVTIGSSDSVNIRINTREQTTVGSAGAAAALPATPELYIRVDINGTAYAIPCFNVS